MAQKSFKLTQEEIKALKELAQERIVSNALIEGHIYRNRFETWEDAYNNLKASGFNHKEIIKRIGEKDVKK